MITFTGSLQKWDTSLKVIAEGYAAKCIWNHNPELEDTGENLFAGTGPLDLRVALEKWFLGELDSSECSICRNKHFSSWSSVLRQKHTISFSFSSKQQTDKVRD